MLTEQEVAKSWRKIIQQRSFSDDVLAKLEALIEELRPESPLRHRLRKELEELRKLPRVGGAV
ncbi:MAG TPA: hypothetical protein VHY20_01245 [Pirellulales bacterium]|nr:hypothetical protein [Pirellulales bacterium]